MFGAGEQPEEPPKSPKFVSIQLKLFFEASFAYDFNLEFAWDLGRCCTGRIWSDVGCRAGKSIWRYIDIFRKLIVG